MKSNHWLTQQEKTLGTFFGYTEIETDFLQKDVKYGLLMKQLRWPSGIERLSLEL